MRLKLKVDSSGAVSTAPGYLAPGTSPGFSVVEVQQIPRLTPPAEVLALYSRRLLTAHPYGLSQVIWSHLVKLRRSAGSVRERPQCQPFGEWQERPDRVHPHGRWCSTLIGIWFRRCSASLGTDSAPGPPVPHPRSGGAARCTFLQCVCRLPGRAKPAGELFPYLTCVNRPAAENAQCVKVAQEVAPASLLRGHRPDDCPKARRTEMKREESNGSEVNL